MKALFTYRCCCFTNIIYQSKILHFYHLHFAIFCLPLISFVLMRTFMLIIHVFVMSSPSVIGFQKKSSDTLWLLSKKPFNQSQWSYWTVGGEHHTQKKSVFDQIKKTFDGQKMATIHLNNCADGMSSKILFSTICFQVSSINRVLRNLVSTKEQSVAHHQVSFRQAKKSLSFLNIFFHLSNS